MRHQVNHNIILGGGAYRLAINTLECGIFPGVPRIGASQIPMCASALKTANALFFPHCYYCATRNSAAAYCISHLNGNHIFPTCIEENATETYSSFCVRLRSTYYSSIYLFIAFHFINKLCAIGERKSHISSVQSVISINFSWGHHATDFCLTHTYTNEKPFFYFSSSRCRWMFFILIYCVVCFLYARETQ